MATSASPVSTAPQATVKGTVVFVQGEAYLRNSSGKLTAIKPGDVVAEGDAIVTAAGAIVELQLPSGAKLSVGPERELLLNDELLRLNWKSSPASAKPEPHALERSRWFSSSSSCRYVASCSSLPRSEREIQCETRTSLFKVAPTCAPAPTYQAHRDALTRRTV